MSIVERYNNVKKSLPDGVTLVLATKYAGAEDIIELAKNDNIIVGENRVQSLLEKYDKVQSATNKVTWHFIGHLQTNKVKYIIDKVDLIQSVDSEKLLLEINEKAKKIKKIQKVLFEVNFFEEKTKTGMALKSLDYMMELAETLGNINVSGIMMMFPVDLDTILLQNCKRFVVDFKGNKWHNTSIPFISLGMSGDYLDAISVGSNMVRIGSLVFR